MGKKIGIFLGLGIVLLSPNIVLSDCVDLGRANSWYVQGGHSIIFYSGPTPIARVNVPYCTLSSSSSVRLLKSYVCDGDKIIIDGSACMIMTISSSSFESY